MINIRTPLRKRLVLFAALAVLLVSSFQPTIALALDEPFYSGNLITLYDPDATEACSGTVGTTVAGDSVEEIIWNFLVGKSLTAEQAAGVMGNIYSESSMVPTRHYRDGTPFTSESLNAWGLVQWDGGRRFTAPDKGVLGKLRADKPHLEKYTDFSYDYFRFPDAKDKIPAADLKELTIFELDYLYQESQTRPTTAAGFTSAGSEWETLKAQKTIIDATLFWHDNFEISGESQAQITANRGPKSQEYFDKYSGTTPGSTSPQSGDCDGGNADTSSIQSTIKSYAWPEFHSPDYVELKPEYKTAIDNASKAGKFIGGGAFPGVDCGGFVSRILQDSGFDPNYNETNGHVSGGQYPYVIKHGWTRLGTGPTIDVADLRPGDVAFFNFSGNLTGDFFDHTAIFAGKIDGFGENSPVYKGVASSSFGGDPGSGFWRSPMAGPEDPTGPDVVWYRKA